MHDDKSSEKVVLHPDDTQTSDSDLRNSQGNPSEETTGSADSSQELEKAKNDYLYLMAEFENFKKNVIKERSELMKFGSERLIVSLLEVLDIFDKALDSQVSEENLASFVKGIELTRVQFRSTLEKFGVKEIDSAGKVFDPHLHQALSAEATDKVPAGHVSTVFKKPYKLHDRVIRPGQVVVAEALKKE